MQTPLQITFQDIEPSEFIESRIREKVAKLERFYDRIVSVRVVVAAPHRSSNNGNAFNVRLDITIPGVIRSDQLRLRQILLNLLGNAAKFTRDGAITLSAARAGERVRFVVRDTGIGMTADDLGRIFDAFQQVDDSTTRRFGGTGLGLTISQRLARLMGGEITVDSVLGEGSRFTLDLPTDHPRRDR